MKQRSIKSENSSMLNDSLSVLDGRYRKQADCLRQYFSESGLIRARIMVEARWLLHLYDELEGPFLQKPTKAVYLELFQLARDPGPDAENAVKEFEKKTNHDVKAVEYYVKDRLKNCGASEKCLSYIHFGCTSEDINNLAYGMLLNESKRMVVLPLLLDLLVSLEPMIKQTKSLAMLARTHGQSASPTTLGKELAVFAHRLVGSYQKILSQKIDGKINGAVGNYNAHVVAFPEVSWIPLSKRFVENRMGLSFNFCTTQIENHDSMVELAFHITHMNTVLIGLCRDMWLYISQGYFSQKNIASEVGSSTMPHKINPIDFENAEGNFGVANALGSHFIEKLPISRLQRDLSDSTVQRNWGSFLGHTVIALKSVLKGLSKVDPNESKIADDLNGAFEVLAEPIQTILRRNGVDDAYERLKSLTRGQGISHNALLKLVKDSEELSEDDKVQLSQLLPSTYVGIAAEIAGAVVLEIKELKATSNPL